MAGPFFLFDAGDGTFHAGDGDWTKMLDSAKTYWRRSRAVADIENVDCAGVLRQRLFAVTFYGDAPPDRVKCVCCGCTNHSACTGGCSWTVAFGSPSDRLFLDICSACVEKRRVKTG